jgi:cation transport protein ChaC
VGGGLIVWVFGYGSLMWDGWEKSWECQRKTLADLPGFRRTFNKASVKNWGSKERPGPTLNLEADANACCRGMAFELSDSKKEELLTYLKAREGSHPVHHEIHLVGVGEAIGFVSIYAGKNMIGGKTIAERAEMARQSSGTSGSCIDYVRGITEKLCELGIDDPAVTEFWEAVNGSR